MSGRDFRTSDLCLATVLSMSGYVLETEVRGRGTVVWVIDAEDRDPDLDSLFEQYTNGESLVEPRTFMQTIRKVRQEMYTLLGIPDRSIPRSQDGGVRSDAAR